MDEEESGLGEATYPATLFSCQQSLSNTHPFQHIFPSNLKTCQENSTISDSNSLLDTSSVVLSDEFGICDDELAVPLCGVVKERKITTKHFSRQKILGTDDALGDDEEIGLGKTTEDLVDLPPSQSRLKFIDVPRVARAAELPSLLSRVQIKQCPECFNLSDECNLCEESSARQLLASYNGAADPSGGLELPEWSTYTKQSNSSSERHSLSELTDLIGKIEAFQADGFVAKVQEKFSKAQVGAILFCVDSGASDHICCRED